MEQLHPCTATIEPLCQTTAPHSPTACAPHKRTCCKEEQPLLAMGACVARESPRAAKKTQGSQKITLTRTHLQPSFSRKEGIEWKLHNMVHDQRLVQKTRLQEIGKVSFSIGILELWNPGILELEDLGSRLPQCLHF